MLNYQILDDARRRFILKISSLNEQFYLAGGTGLALHLGHRLSYDFDFFSEKEFETEKLFSDIKTVCPQSSLKIVQKEKNTLGLLVDNEIKLTFLYYPYSLIQPLVYDELLKIASIADIGCMKLTALVGRAALRDYVDLYFILQKINLQDLLILAKQKYPELDQNLILKSLVFFDDVEQAPINFCEGCTISFIDIKKYLTTITIQNIKQLNNI